MGIKLTRLIFKALEKSTCKFYIILVDYIWVCCIIIENINALLWFKVMILSGHVSLPSPLKASHLVLQRTSADIVITCMYDRIELGLRQTVTLQVRYSLTRMDLYNKEVIRQKVYSEG